ncbi:MAG: endo alpha-1,4 polygalactosaminidase [Deltaproteobacteria bacterium]|nr:endo alpha-1,4 polygalactosaminidase [Deltaproteobacteria bacterium]
MREHAVPVREAMYALREAMYALREAMYALREAMYARARSDVRPARSDVRPARSHKNAARSYKYADAVQLAISESASESASASASPAPVAPSDALRDESLLQGRHHLAQIARKTIRCRIVMKKKMQITSSFLSWSLSSHATSMPWKSAFFSMKSDSYRMRPPKVPVKLLCPPVSNAKSEASSQRNSALFLGVRSGIVKDATKEIKMNLTRIFLVASLMMYLTGCGDSSTNSADTDTHSDSNTNADSETDSTIGADSSSDSVNNNGSDTDADSSTANIDTTATDSDSQQAGDTGGDTTVGTETESVADTQSDTNTDSNSDTGSDTGDTATDAATVRLPPANAPWDYQIGGGYTPPSGVQVVSRDREDSPAPGLYNICYVNGFQIQPHEENWWKTNHPDLILRDSNGDPVVDEDWDEMLLDVRTEQKREALAVIVGGWIAQCATDGFDAVEIDNLDSCDRSNGLIDSNDNIAFMGMLSDIAHANGLASSQKNAAAFLNDIDKMKTDFAVVEECNRWNECGDFQDAYGDLLFIVEYRTQDFDKGCSAFPELSIVLRNLDVSTPSSGNYVYDGC